MICNPPVYPPFLSLKLTLTSQKTAIIATHILCVDVMLDWFKLPKINMPNTYMVDLSDMLNAEIIIETENEFQTTTETSHVQE